jgi:hypothetical protein
VGWPHLLLSTNVGNPETLIPTPAACRLETFDHAKPWVKSVSFNPQQWHSIDRVKLLAVLPDVDPSRLRGPQGQYGGSAGGAGGAAAAAAGGAAAGGAAAGGGASKATRKAAPVAPVFDQCAVVGDSAGLLSTRLGQLIDRCAYVLIRCLRERGELRCGSCWHIPKGGRASANQQGRVARPLTPASPEGTAE